MFQDHLDAMGQVPVGVLLSMFGASEDQCQGGETLPQHRCSGLQVNNQNCQPIRENNAYLLVQVLSEVPT